MPKDPAFLWYWSDWGGGTKTFTRHLKGCYMDLLEAQFNSGALSIEEIRTVLGADFGQSWPTLQKKFTVTDTGLFYNERMEFEKRKRKEFTESRRRNLSSKKEHHMDHHMDEQVGNHMENGKGSCKNINGQPGQIGLIPDMVAVFMQAFPHYEYDRETDYPACLAIAQRIALSKRWTRHDLMNSRRNDALAEWQLVVDFVVSDDWYSKQSISMLLKKWQDLNQAKNQKSKTESSAPIKGEPTVGSGIHAARKKHNS